MIAVDGFEVFDEERVVDRRLCCVANRLLAQADEAGERQKLFCRVLKQRARGL
jgi:hypothetical protein